MAFSSVMLLMPATTATAATHGVTSRFVERAGNVQSGTIFSDARNEEGAIPAPLGGGAGRAGQYQILGTNRDFGRGDQCAVATAAMLTIRLDSRIVPDSFLIGTELGHTRTFEITLTNAFWAIFEGGATLMTPGSTARNYNDETHTAFGSPTADLFTDRVPQPANGVRHMSNVFRTNLFHPGSLINSTLVDSAVADDMASVARARFNELVSSGTNLNNMNRNAHADAHADSLRSVITAAIEAVDEPGTATGAARAAAVIAAAKAAVPATRLAAAQRDALFEAFDANLTALTTALSAPLDGSGNTGAVATAFFVAGVDTALNAATLAHATLWLLKCFRSLQTQDPDIFLQQALHAQLLKMLSEPLSLPAQTAICPVRSLYPRRSLLPTRLTTTFLL